MKIFQSGWMIGVGIILLFGFPMLADAKVQASQSIRLDLETIEKGYTVNLEEAGFRLVMPPSVTDHPITVNIQTTDLPKQRTRSMIVSSVIEVDIHGEDIQLSLQKMMQLHFTTTAKRSGREAIHFWDEGKKIWRELPTSVRGSTAMAPFSLGYAKLAVFEFDVPDHGFALKPQALRKGAKVHTPSKNFVIQLPKDEMAKKPIHVVLKTDAEEGTKAPEDPNLNRLSPIYSYDLDAEELEAGQFVNIRVNYEQGDDGPKIMMFWDGLSQEWKEFPSEDVVGESAVAAQSPFSYAKVAVFSDRSKIALGKASWYRSRRYTLAAANNDYPFGSVLRVTNLENKQFVDVEVVSTGPFIPGRIIDLTLDAFQAIANPYTDGVIDVHVEIA